MIWEAPYRIKSALNLADEEYQPQPPPLGLRLRSKIIFGVYSIFDLVRCPGGRAGVAPAEGGKRI